MQVSLVPVDQMPTVSGLRSPHQLYVVARAPALLAGMPRPTATTPWVGLGALGLRHIVCLTTQRPNYNPAPLAVLHSTALEDLVHRRPPRDPQGEERLIRDAVREIVEKISVGEGVLVHCAGGTGRTGTVLGCVLTSLGSPAAEVVAYLDVLNQRRGKVCWPESKWQAELVLRF